MSHVKYRSIPSAGSSIEELRQSVEAMKENIELMLGQRGSDEALARVFFGTDNAPIGHSDGDLWISGKKVSAWKGNQWVLVGELT